MKLNFFILILNICLSINISYATIVSVKNVPQNRDTIYKAEIEKLDVWTLKETLQKILNYDIKEKQFNTLESRLNNIRLFIEERFEEDSIKPFGMSYISSFSLSDIGRNGRGMNIIGILPTEDNSRFSYRDTVNNQYSQEYIIIGAHYDNLGADYNASGVAALLEVARALSYDWRNGKKFKYNILFVAFDANRFSSYGSYMFLNSCGIKFENIKLFINIDKLGGENIKKENYIGTRNSSRNKNKNYVYLLGSQTFKNASVYIDSANKNNLVNIEYRMSQDNDIENLIISLGEQINFATRDIPYFLLTSGIGNYTTQQTDNESNIKYKFLLKRTEFLYNLISIIAE